MYPVRCPQMTGIDLSIGLPSWPWQPVQTLTLSPMFWANAGPAPTLNTMARIVPLEINRPNRQPPLWIHSASAQQKRGRNRPRSGHHHTTRARSIEREGDDVVAAPEVDLDVTARANHDVLLAAHHVARRRCIDARTGAEAPQFLAVGRVVGCELAVAFTCENKTAGGGEDAADHRFRRLHLPFDLAGVVVDGGDVARLLFARDGREGAAKPQLAVRIGRALDPVMHRLMQVDGVGKLLPWIGGDRRPFDAAIRTRKHA